MRSHLAWLGEKARAMRAADAARMHGELDASHAEAARLVEAAEAEAEAKALAGQLAIVREANRRMTGEVSEAKAELARAQAARQAEGAELRDDLERVRTRLNTARAHIAGLERRLSTCGELLREVYASRTGYVVCPLCLLTWPSHRPACVIGKLEEAIGDNGSGHKRASSFAASFEGRKTEAG